MMMMTITVMMVWFWSIPWLAIALMNLEVWIEPNSHGDCGMQWNKKLRFLRKFATYHVVVTMVSLHVLCSSFSGGDFCFLPPPAFVNRHTTLSRCSSFLLVLGLAWVRIDFPLLDGCGEQIKRVSMECDWEVSWVRRSRGGRSNTIHNMVLCSKNQNFMSSSQLATSSFGAISTRSHYS